jgi:uncharacterized protein (TIGR03382 family)
MKARSLRRRCGAIAGLVPSALLLVLVSSGGCSRSGPAPLRGLEQEFPTQAAAILDGGSGFRLGASGFAPVRPAVGDWGLRRLRPELPASGEGSIVFHLGGGQTVQVQEVGAAGPGRLARNAVSYARAGGTTFWTATSSGVEEWLHLDQVRRGTPAASWTVTGATLRARNEAVMLTTPQGGHLQVKAPAAFAAGGAPIHARLTAHGSTIDLYVDADAERVLVDPSWFIAGVMPTPRQQHTAALLGNGKVLIAGGVDDNFVTLASGALYNPLTDSWAATPSMNVARVSHRAASLVDGTAFVSGGIDDTFTTLYAAEVYSTATGAWVAKPDMIDARFNHTATRLADGRVLLVGGHNDYGSGGGGSGGSGGPGAISSCEIYDPNLAGGTFLPASPLFVERERHTATLLQDGTVLVAGGEDNGFLLSEAEIYDPVTDSWTQVAPMSSVREDFTATRLQDGNVLVTGGFGGEILEDSAEIYNPVTQSWFFVGSMNDRRVRHTASLLPNGAVLVAGGENDGSYSSVEIYDPFAQSFSSGPSMNDSRSQHSATLLASGSVLVAGGAGGFPSSELFTLGQLGEGCFSGLECASGNCVEDVCCDTPCDTVCFSCTTVSKGGGADGVCGPTEAGTPPTNGGPIPNVGANLPGKTPIKSGIFGSGCFDGGPSSCGTNGLCDGVGSCQLYVAGTECSAAFCSEGGGLTQADHCDGAGSCVLSGDISCDPGSCANDVCDLSCALDTDCTPNGYCKTGTCTVKKADGTPSISPSECASGIVADGVCCDTDCAGPCVACTTFLKGGGQSGVCEPIIAGSDPQDECADQGAASCGTNGSCDGAGACALYPKNAVCVAPSCAGSTMIDASLCDGKGVCTAGGMIDCAPAMCVNGACAAVCVNDSDCLGQSYCGAGTCAAKKITGAPAAGNNECLSAFAADGVCCASACDAGPCDVCSVAAGAQKEGECTLLSGPSCDDGNPCTSSETCAAGVCQGGTPVLCPAMDVCHDAGSCDSETGACVPVPKADGAPCDDGNPCTADGCIAGACISTHLLDGTPCTGGVCIAGGCVLDTSVMTGSSSSGSSSSSSGSTSSSSSSTGSSSGGTGGEGGGSSSDTGELVGSGCSTTGGGASTGAPAGLLLAMLGLFRRRRASR